MYFSDILYLMTVYQILQW